MTFQVCRFHADEAITGVALGDGTLSFTCDRRTGHPTSGPYSWLGSPEASGSSGLGGLADELGLAVELPATLSQYRGRWVEYGIVERAYALSNPDDFAQYAYALDTDAIPFTFHVVNDWAGHIPNEKPQMRSEPFGLNELPR